MPTYEYRCSGCEHTFDLFQKMSDEPVAECAQCGSKARRLISGGAGLLFKGEGFYITDYRSEGYKKAAREGAGEESSSRGGEGDGGRADTDKGGGEDKSKPAAAKPDGGRAQSNSARSARPDATGSGRSDAGGSARASSGRDRPRRGEDSGGRADMSSRAKRGGKKE